MSSSLDRWKRCCRPVFFWCLTWAASARRRRVLEIISGREGRFGSVDPTREPRGHLLDDPQIAVGIAEGAEGAVAGALRVDTGLARLNWERRTVPDVTDVNAEVDEPSMGLHDVRDNEGSLGPAWRGAFSPRPNVMEPGEPGGVNWTKRSPSIGAMSSSSRQPSCW